MSLNIGIIIGSIREGRVGDQVANWILNQALNRKDGNSYEIVDLKTFDLPLLGSVHTTADQAAAIGAWAAKLSEFDGFVLVTPEYNHGIPGALKNAFDFLKEPLHNKAIALVGYGFLGAARALATAKTSLSYQQLAIVQQQLNLSLNVDFENYNTFKPQAYHDGEVTVLLDQLTAWSKALKPLRK